jgi:acetyl esterase/lipase
MSNQQARFDRRSFCRLAAAPAGAAVVAQFAGPGGAINMVRAADPPTLRKQTFVYKKVDPLEIKADVHRADDAAPRPVLVWIHGGALIMGHRAGIDGRIMRLARDAGYAIVSIDYRLAPETKLPAIIEDVEDAFRWIRTHGPSLFAADVSRIVVAGGSAGGYLTLTAGFRVRPRPAALISLWGYGDLVGDWYSRPSPHPRHHQSKLGREQALAQVSGPPIADARDRKGDGGAFYQHCRQHGIWPKEVAGWDPHDETDKFVPYMPVRNVTKDFPATVLIHGTKDTDVPYEQSTMMAAEFKKHGVAHELITVPDAEHGLPGVAPERVAAAYQAAWDFVVRHMPHEK